MDLRHFLKRRATITALDYLEAKRRKPVHCFIYSIAFFGSRADQGASLPHNTKSRANVSDVEIRALREVRIGGAPTGDKGKGSDEAKMKNKDESAIAA